MTPTVLSPARSKAGITTRKLNWYASLPQGKGRLNIASKVYEYSNGVVILMHSNITHKSFDNDFESENYKEMVLQIAPEKMSLLNTHFPNPNQLILHSLTCLYKESY
jgi:hypothetical protein